MQPLDSQPMINLLVCILVIQDDQIQFVDPRPMINLLVCILGIRDDLIQSLDRRLPVILISGTIWSRLWTADYLWSWYPGRSDPASEQQITCDPDILDDLIQPRNQQTTCDPDVRDDLIQPLNSSLPVILISETIWTASEQQIPLILISRTIWSSLWTTDYLWSWYPGRSDPVPGPQITCDPDIRDDLIQPQDRGLPVILISRTIRSSLWTPDWYTGFAAL